MHYLESLSKILSKKTILSPKIKNSAQVCWTADLVLKKYFFDSSRSNQKNATIKAISYDRSVLKVRIDSNAMANEVKLKEKTLISEIEKKLGVKNKIKKIRTEVR